MAVSSRVPCLSRSDLDGRLGRRCWGQKRNRASPPPPVEYSTPYSTPAGGQSLLEEEPPAGGGESPSMGQLTMSPVSAGFTAYLDSYMEPRLSTAGQPHVRLASLPRPSAIAPPRQGSSRRSSHYACKGSPSTPACPPCVLASPGLSPQAAFGTVRGHSRSQEGASAL